MTDTTERRVTMWTKNGLAVWAYRSRDGDLHIDGQDLTPGGFGDEYEYFLVVSSKQVPLINSALGAPDADVLDLLVQHAHHIVHQGERSWLRSIGVDAKFFSMSR